MTDTELQAFTKQHDHADITTKGTPLGAPETALDGSFQPMSDFVLTVPPMPLVAPFLATREEAVLYGPGGVGKGTFTAWLALQATQTDLGASILILDYENRENEWGNRLIRLGGSKEQRNRIHYGSPFSRKWMGPRGPLHEISPYIKQWCNELGTTLLIVDSYTAATTSEDKLGGLLPAKNYFDGLRDIDRPSLTLAHVTGNAQRFPDRPFGSVSIRNFARELIAIAPTDLDYTTENEYGLTHHGVQLRFTKTQERLPPPDQILKFSYVPNNGPITVVHEQVTLNFGELIHETLMEAETAFTAPQIGSYLKETKGEIISLPQIHQALRQRIARHKDILKEGTGQKATYRAI
jgi:hypothetical protein